MNEPTNQEIKQWHDSMEQGVPDWYDLAGILLKRQGKGESLEDFYQWAKKIGHYPITEAVERYRSICSD